MSFCPLKCGEELWYKSCYCWHHLPPYATAEWINSRSSPLQSCSTFPRWIDFPKCPNYFFRLQSPCHLNFSNKWCSPFEIFSEIFILLSIIPLSLPSLHGKTNYCRSPNPPNHFEKLLKSLSFRKSSLKTEDHHHFGAH